MVMQPDLRDPDMQFVACDVLSPDKQNILSFTMTQGTQNNELIYKILNSIKLSA